MIQFLSTSRDSETETVLVHIDASGNMGQEPVYVMAGYFAQANSWEKFSVEWQRVLDEPRQASAIKASHLMACDKAFVGWSDAERDAKLKLLAATINRYVAGSINIVVPIQSWRKHVVGRLDRRHHDRPYYFAVHNIMATMIKYMHFNKIDEKVDFVFDSEDAEPIAEIQDTFDEFVTYAPDPFRKYIGNKPIFERDEKVLPLQAADLMAWHVRRAYHEGAKGNEYAITSVICRELFEGISRVECKWQDSQIEEMVSFILSRRLWKSHQQPEPIWSGGSPWML